MAEFDFVKLADVNTVEEVDNDVNVLVEDGGEIKKVPMSKVSGGGSAEKSIVVELELDMVAQKATLVNPFEEIAQAFGADIVKKCTLRQITLPDGSVNEYNDCIMRVHSATEDGEIIVFGVMYPSIDQAFCDFAIMGAGLYFNYIIFHKDGRIEPGTRFIVDGN